MSTKEGGLADFDTINAGENQKFSLMVYKLEN